MDARVVAARPRDRRAYADPVTRRGDGGLVEVVLEEDLPDAAPPAGDDGAADAPAARAGRRRWRLTAVAVGLVVVLVLAVVQASAQRREEEALLRYADVPGVLASLAEPPSETWRLSLTEMWHVAGAVITVDPDDGVVGRDLATGDVRWTVPLPDGVEAWTVGCAEVDERTTVAVCAFPRLPAGAPGDRAEGDAGLQVLDPVDGRVLRPLDLGSSVVGAAVEAGDLLVAEADRADGVRVTRADLRTGDRRWQVTLASYDPGRDVRMRLLDDLVVLEGRTTVVLDAADGRELGRWTGASDGRASAVAHVVGVPGGGYGVWESRFAGRWYGTGPEVRLDGEPVEPPVDDRSAPEVVLLEPADGDLLRAVDAGTGDELWQRPKPRRVLLRLGGRVVVTGEGRLESLDLRTGRTVWSAPLDASQDADLGDPMTDGLRVVVRGERDGALQLTAFDLDDGSRIWQAPVPAGSDYVTVVGDRVAAVGRLEGSERQTMAVLG